MSSISNLSGHNRDIGFPFRQSIHVNRNFNKIIYPILKDVNNLLKDSSEIVEKMRQSEKKDLLNILTVTEQIRLGLEMATAVKNKIVESYCH